MDGHVHGPDNNQHSHLKTFEIWTNGVKRVIIVPVQTAADTNLSGGIINVEPLPSVAGASTQDAVVEYPNVSAPERDVCTFQQSTSRPSTSSDNSNKPNMIRTLLTAVEDNCTESRIQTTVGYGVINNDNRLSAIRSSVPVIVDIDEPESSAAVSSSSHESLHLMRTTNVNRNCTAGLSNPTVSLSDPLPESNGISLRDIVMKQRLAPIQLQSSTKTPAHEAQKEIHREAPSLSNATAPCVVQSDVASLSLPQNGCNNSLEEQVRRVKITSLNGNCIISVDHETDVDHRPSPVLPVHVPTPSTSSLSAQDLSKMQPSTTLLYFPQSMGMRTVLRSSILSSHGICEPSANNVPNHLATRVLTQLNSRLPSVAFGQNTLQFVTPGSVSGGSYAYMSPIPVQQNNQALSLTQGSTVGPSPSGAGLTAVGSVMKANGFLQSLRPCIPPSQSTASGNGVLGTLQAVSLASAAVMPVTNPGQLTIVKSVSLSSGSYIHHKVRHATKPSDVGHVPAPGSAISLCSQSIATAVSASAALGLAGKQLPLWTSLPSAPVAACRPPTPLVFTPSGQNIVCAANTTFPRNGMEQTRIPVLPQSSFKISSAQNLQHSPSLYPVSSGFLQSRFSLKMPTVSESNTSQSFASSVATVLTMPVAPPLLMSPFIGSNVRHSYSVSTVTPGVGCSVLQKSNASSDWINLPSSSAVRTNSTWIPPAISFSGNSSVPVTVTSSSNLCSVMSSYQSGSELSQLSTQRNATVTNGATLLPSLVQAIPVAATSTRASFTMDLSKNVTTSFPVQKCHKLRRRRFKLKRVDQKKINHSYASLRLPIPSTIIHLLPPGSDGSNLVKSSHAAESNSLKSGKLKPQGLDLDVRSPPKVSTVIRINSSGLGTFVLPPASQTASNEAVVPHSSSSQRKRSELAFYNSHTNILGNNSAHTASAVTSLPLPSVTMDTTSVILPTFTVDASVGKCASEVPLIPTTVLSATQRLHKRGKKKRKRLKFDRLSDSESDPLSSSDSWSSDDSLTIGKRSQCSQKSKKHQRNGVLYKNTENDQHSAVALSAYVSLEKLFLEGRTSVRLSESSINSFVCCSRSFKKTTSDGTDVGGTVANKQSYRLNRKVIYISDSE